MTALSGQATGGEFAAAVIERARIIVVKRSTGHLQLNSSSTRKLDDEDIPVRSAALDANRPAMCFRRKSTESQPESR